ncbi:hypothetical protein NP493_503g01030 [Ridgeia piscesae]|uniref:ATP-binding cassette sub-family F member 3 n=1 Tax=Ridgeia piscesae TaxID=27915 RepID=A0AAD9NTW3_RIDPI|nr:hypothetical protein NP493_503g01030 [Ridgeia piscesae]
MAASGDSRLAIEILQSCFPALDEAVKEYVEGILTGGLDDFDTVEDLHEAIGNVLVELDPDKTQDDVLEICDRLFCIMKQTDSGIDKNGHMKILTAPVHLGSLAENLDETCEEHSSIWLDRRKNNSSQVDLKKLEKAEAKIKQKQEKRTQQTSTKSNGSHVENTATASQQSSRKDKTDSSSSCKTFDIRLENFDVAYGEKVLLKGADLVMAFGRRYGLVGRNGIGKTTLLRMLANQELRIPSHISILHVEQEVVGDDTVALDSVLQCDTRRYNLMQEEKQINEKLNSGSETDSRLNSRLAEVYHELEVMEADRAPARAGTILAGLGFSPEMQRRITREFSGGWRMRLALARALFTIPDLLLLDEPTNMLDMKAIIWLENYLQTWPTTILVVSHDREFLNAVVTDILHLHTRIIDAYRGDYEAFTRTRNERLKNQQKEYDAQKQYRDHIQVFIDRFRYNANRASQVQSKLKLLEKLPELKPIEKESEVNLRFPECNKLNPPVLQLDEVNFGYSPDNLIFQKLNVSCDATSRICIVGENGAGKTTLLKILLGELEPITGFRIGHRNIRIGYFSQHHVDQLDMSLCSIEVLAAKFPGKPSEFYRQQLGSFGVSGELATRPVTSLSGGQKSRVAFALMAMTVPNFFILDEPTNHLDMETIEALGKALNKFLGGVILVSHDERLIRVICTELWLVKDKTVTVLEGGISEYKKLVEDELAAQN